jgi:hypothetical protein
MAANQTPSRVAAHEQDKTKVATPVQPPAPGEPIKVEPANVPQTKA